MENRKTYVPIHTHDESSLLDGLASFKEYIKKAKEYGMPGISMTNHGRIALVDDFYQACKENDINPIIGCEFYVSHGKYDDKTPENKDRWHITVLAKNNQGVKNLYHLSYLMNKNGFYYKPRIDDDLLFKYKEGLIVLSGCAGSEINSHLRRDEGYEYDFDKAVEVAKKFKEQFGEDYYIELQDHPMRSTGKQWPIQDSLNKDLTKIAKMLNIKRVLTADCHYANSDDHEAHEVLLCIGTGKYLSDKDRMTLDEFDLSLKSPEVLYERWKDDVEVLENTLEINDKVHIEFNLEEQAMPEFNVPDGMSMIQYLKLLTYRGAVKRFLKEDSEFSISECYDKLIQLNENFHGQNFTGIDILERIEMELGVVNKIGVPGYFLIVQEYINWAKNNGIRVGCGRGSSLASLMCYCLRITEVNPLGISGFMFERFLNPDRISLPDVDTDFEARYRDKVIQHFKDIYGEDHVVGIGVQSTMRSKNAVRDVARVLEYPFDKSLELTKLLPDAEHTGAPKLKEYIASDEELQKLYDNPEQKCETPEFRERYNTEPEVKRIVDIAIKLEGKQRNHGIHACGTVISPEPIWNYFPTEISNDVMATTVPMHSVELGGVNEKGGLLKIDVLGLSTLDLISDTLSLIKKTKGIDVDIDNVDLEDEETLKAYREGRCKDTFTFSSPGMQETLKGLKVDKFSDLVLVNAMYRPGAMDYIKDAIDVKNGVKKPYYWFNQDKLLEETYGIIAYQEQGMEIAKFMGFTGGETDNMRKALAKKNKGFLDAIFPTFKEKAIKKGFSEQEVDKYWDSLIGFSRYSFNKAHAYAYAVLGYQTGYLKTHYPSEYYAAYFNHVSGDKEKLGKAIKNAKEIGINVLPPDAEKSDVNFTVDDNGNILYGFSAIKGVGKSSEIILERRKEKEINSVKDFFTMFENNELNVRKMEMLAKAGVLDNICKKDPLIKSRSRLLFNFEEIYEKYKTKKNVKRKQQALFEIENDEPRILEPLPKYKIQTLQYEKEVLGTYVSKHPLDYASEIEDENWENVCNSQKDLENKTKKTVKCLGTIESCRVITTKKGQKMCFLTMLGKNISFDVTVFPTTFDKYKDILKNGNSLFMTNYVDDYNEGDRRYKYIMHEAKRVLEI